MSDAVPQTVGAKSEAGAAARPKVARVFIAYLVAAVLGFAGSGLAAAAFVAVQVANGADASQVQATLASHPVFLMVATLPLQLTLAGVAFIAARQRQRSILYELGLIMPRIGAARWGVLVVGTCVPFAAAMGAALLCPSISGAERIDGLWRSMPLALTPLWVIFIGAAPGVCEELFFRGMMQRRLISAWGPLWAIGVTTVLFAVLHMEPATIALALVIGTWLGFVAWRTGSTMVTMVLHALINSIWNALQIIDRRVAIADSIWITGASVLGVVSLVCFGFAIRDLIRIAPPSPPAPPAPARGG